MPTFAYEALNGRQAQKGTIEAASSEEAMQRIKAQGYFPTSVREQKVKKSASAEGDRPRRRGAAGSASAASSNKQLTLFTRQLSTLQDAGLPLLRSLQILENQQKPGKLKNIADHVCEEVEGGTSCRTRWPSTPRRSTGCTSRWSTPARSAACWTSSSSAWPSSWRRPSG
jgi:type IV pilus assembly protein PilC